MALLRETLCMICLRTWVLWCDRGKGHQRYGIVVKIFIKIPKMLIMETKVNSLNKICI